MNFETIQEIVYCEKNLDQLSAKIDEQTNQLKTWAQSLAFSKDSLIHQLNIGRSEPTRCIDPESSAVEINNLRNLITTSIEKQWLASCSIIWQFVKELFLFQRACCKQHSQQNEGSDQKIDLTKAKQQLENFLTQFESAFSVLGVVIQALREIPQNCSGIWFPVNCPNLSYLSTITVENEESLINRLYELRKESVERLILVVDSEPTSVLMTTKKLGVRENRKDSQFPSETQLSCQLYNIFGCVTDVHKRTPISLDVALINEKVAREVAIAGSKLPVDITTKIHSNVSNSSQLELDSMLSTTFESKGPESDLKAVKSRLMVWNMEERKQNGAKVKTKAPEEKYYFYITVNLQLPTTDPMRPFHLKAWALSAPICICTNTSQATRALASASWARHFSETHQIFPEPRQYASVFEIKQVLQSHFKEWTNGLELDDSHLYFFETWILEEICKLPNQDFKNVAQSVNLEWFFRSKLDGRDFSIWSWFLANIKLLRRPYLSNALNNNYFKAFITKDDAFKTLSTSDAQPGDFMLRFSQSRPADISAVFVKPDMTVSVASFMLDVTSEESFKVSFENNIYHKSKTGNDILLRLYPIKVSRVEAFPKRQEVQLKSRFAYGNVTNF